MSRTRTSVKVPTCSNGDQELRQVKNKPVKGGERLFPARSDPCMAYQVALPVGALIRRDMEGTTNTERDE